MTNNFALPPDPPETEPVEAPGQVNPLYERQASLGLRAPTVTIVGCGGVGCWVALSLVLGGVTELHLYDGDTLSLHNLNRFPLPPSANGEMKSVALASWLRTLRPDPNIEIRARGSFIEGVHRIETSWVVCATDSLKSRRMVYEIAKSMGFNYLEVGADGERWGMAPAPPEFQTELEANPGYQTVPVHVGPCMMAGAAAAYYVLHNQRLNHSFNVDWDKGPDFRSVRVGGWASLKFSSMVEVAIPDIPTLTCDHCGRQVEVDLLALVSHLRMERRDLELIEAKRIAEAMMAEYQASLPIDQPLPEPEDEGLELEAEEIEEARDEQTF